MFGAKLSWCQIVRCQIVLVPNCPGAKLSTFIILVPNCLLLLSWCQIVPFIILVPNCPVPNCPVPNCPTIKIRYHIFPEIQRGSEGQFDYFQSIHRFSAAKWGLLSGSGYKSMMKNGIFFNIRIT